LAVLRFWQAEKQPQGETDLRFSSTALPFTHEADLDNSLPFLASAAIDIDGIMMVILTFLSREKAAFGIMKI